jgi:ATP-dependent Clp protease, protease subunit
VQKERQTNMTEAAEDSKNEQSFIFLPSSNNDSESRMIGLYGDVEEKTASEIVYSLFSLNETAEKEVAVDNEDPEKGTTVIKEPIKFLISTYGGSAADMFSIYDTMRMVRENTEIHTIGLGKVQSAGVLLLAAGTKGHRKIGKNCRVMIHAVNGGVHGELHNIENEFKEIKFTQTQYIKSLAIETGMTEKQLKKIVRQKVDVYLNCEEAVQMGIADVVI